MGTWRVWGGLWTPTAPGGVGLRGGDGAMGQPWGGYRADVGQLRCGAAVGLMWGSCGADVGQIWGRYGADIRQMWGGYRADVGQMWG